MRVWPWVWCVSVEWQFHKLQVAWALKHKHEESATVSYNSLDARHSCKGVILLVGLWSDAHLSVTLVSDILYTVSDMQRPAIPNSVIMFVSYGWHFAALFWISILQCFYQFSAPHLFLKECGIRRTLQKSTAVWTSSVNFWEVNRPGFICNLSNHLSHLTTVYQI